MRYLLLAVAFLIIMLASAFSDSQDLNAIDANSLEGGTEVFPQDQNPVPLGGGEVDLNGEATPLPPEDQNTIPPNVDTLPPPDENATPPEAIEEPLQPSSRSLIFVTPLAEQVISGVQVVIVSLQNFINVTAQWFSFNGEDFNGTLLENTLSADLNTLSAPNGPYILTANACEDSNCYAGSLVVSVLNELPPSDEQILDENTVVPQQDEPLQGETLYYLRPSNVFSALSIFGSDEDLVDSGAEFAAVPAGTYSAKIEFLGNEAIEDAMFTGLVVDSNATLIEYSELQVSPLMKRFFEPVSAFSITSSATYSEVDIILAVPEKSSALYFCQEQERGDCRENWEKITEIGDEEMVSVSEFGIYAFGTFGEESVREFFANILGKRGQPKFFVKSLKSSYFEQDAELGFIAAGGKEGRVRFGDFKRMLRIRELQLREDGEPLAHGSFSTPVVAVDSPDGVGAEITLPTTGPVNAIMKCDGWDFGSSSCATEWVATEIEFAQSPDSITFLANSFSAYGGAEITVVNVQSYPVVGGEWVVRFTTKGKADLRITPIEGTTWSSDSETEDLKFLSLKCGDAEKTVAWDGITAVFEDYQCAKTGFETSQVFTPGRHALLFEFGESSAIARNLAGDIGVLIASTRTANSVATATPEVLVSIPAASFTTDANYMIFASVHVKGSDGSARDQTVIRHGGSQFTNVLEQQENQGASTDQWVYSAITKWTAVNGEDIDLHGQCLVSSDTCTYDEIFLMAIPLDALTENVDWLYVEDTDALSNMNDTFSSNVGAQITFTPDGTSDYLVFSNSRILIDAAGNNVARMELHDGSSQLALVERDGENTADQSVLSVLHVLQAPSASSKTYSLRFQGDSSDDHSSSRLFILRMSAFKNSDANVVNETYAITNSTSVRSTLSMSLAADGNVVAFYGAAFANALGTPASNKVSVTAREGSNVRVQSSGTELTSWNAVANTEGADRLFAALFDSFNIADASSHTYDVAVLGQTTTGTNRHDNKQAIVAVFSTRFADGSLSFSIANPPSDGNTTINVDTNFLVSGTTTCSTNNCGLVDTNLQYCVGSGCSNWVDMNTVSTSPLYIASGSQPQSSTIGKDQSYNASWIVRSTVAQDYELRLRGDGANTDANVTNGTDRTITTQAGGAADYSFTLSLPSSGCTQGKGSIDAGTSCDKGYFEASASGGTADANGVNPEGQTSTIPFFVYDNQSTEANDLNISLDLNAVLPSTLKLKAGMLYDGWAPVCSASGIDADISGNGNNADINYGIVTAGVSGNALGFSGIDRANGMNIDSGDVNMVVPISGDGNASVSFWFRADSNNSNRVLFLKPIQYIDRNGTIETIFEADETFTEVAKANGFAVVLDGNRLVANIFSGATDLAHYNRGASVIANETLNGLCDSRDWIDGEFGNCFSEGPGKIIFINNVDGNITVDLGASHNLGRISQSVGTDDRYPQFVQVETSTDDVTYTKIEDPAPGGLNSDPSLTTYYLANRPIRYIKVAYGKDLQYNSGVRAFELDAYDANSALTYQAMSEITGWHHVTLTYSSAGGKMYFDGNLAATNATNLSFRKWDSNYFFLAGGCWNYIPFSPGDSTPSCGHQDFNGAMDEVRIYTRELSETDVNYLYANPGAQGNTSNLQARWEFGGTCIDVNSGSQNVGKATYTAGTQDLNVFLWSDFIGAAQGLREDRNVTSTGGAS